MKKLISQLLLLVGLTLLFNACGSDSGSDDSAFGGTSSSSTTTTNPTNDGSYSSGTSTDDSSIDSQEPSSGDESSDRETKSGTPVMFVDTFCSGISYVGISVDNTITGSGTTGTDGYAYIPEGSQYIQFELGGLVLGKVKASQVITITELFRNSNLDDNRVMFAARLLLTLDSDSDPDNGIQISEDVAFNIGNFEGSDATGNYRLTTLTKSEEEVTVILTELVAFLGIPNSVVSQEDAKLHLENSMEELEEGVFTQTINAGENENCPYGGIARVHRVDFDKTDDDTEPKEYVDYFCDETTIFDKKTHHTLSENNDKCPNGGTRIHHILYNESTRIDSQLQNEENRVKVDEYDEYVCNGAEAYKKNTFIIYTTATSSDDCDYRIKKKTQVKKENNISILSSDNEYICADKTLGLEKLFVKLNTLIDDEVCQGSGVRADYFNDSDRTDFVSSSYYCNQATERGFVNGEHIVTAVDANDTVCPHGGTEIKHKVDYDNNGEFDTFYSDVKCDDYNGSLDPNLQINVKTTKIAITPDSDADDIKHCPFGGYRLDRVMKQGNKIIKEYSDYNCTDITKLIDDQVDTETLKASEYDKEDGPNKWCPNGGFKYNHSVYFNSFLNHTYYDINCSPVTTKESNRTVVHEFGHSKCPDGGNTTIVSVEFNGDSAHPSNYEYNVTVCKGLDYNQTHEKNETKVLEFGDKTCPYGGKKITHKRLHNDTNVEIPHWEYNTTHCDSLEYNQTETDEQIVKRYILGDGNTICPDGGVVKNFKQYIEIDGERKYIPGWDYNSTICEGLDYNQTKDIPRVVKNNPSVCPFGGRIVEHRRYVLDEQGEPTQAHVARWDYNTTHCDALDYNQTVDRIERETLKIGNKDCPDGGEIISHQRYRDIDGNKEYSEGDIAVPDWSYEETVCKGLDYNETVEKTVTETLLFGDDDCPDGGTFVKHLRYLDGNKNGTYEADKDTVRIERWDYNTTHCTGLEYNQTLEHNNTLFDWEYGESEICPDGGKVIEHIRYIDKDGSKTYTDGDIHVEKWDFNSTHCEGLVYKESVERNVTIYDWSYGDSEICPDGGKVIEHKRYIDKDKSGDYTVADEHIAKWDYNSTHCVGLDHNKTVEKLEIDTLLLGNSDCPDGGKFIKHLFYLDANENDEYDAGDTVRVEKFDFNTTHCVGLDYNATLEHNNTLNDWKYGESEVCPDGGKVIEHIRYIDKNDNKRYDDGDTHIGKWDFNTTHCVGIVYKDTLEYNNTLFDWKYGESTICPDGGKVIEHIRYIDKNNNQTYEAATDTHIEKWDFNTTHCVGIVYKDTLEHNNTLFDWKYGESEVCPDGGTVIEHIRYIDKNGDQSYTEGTDTHIEKWDFNTTHCVGLEYNATLEHNITLDDDPAECPDGGEIITHIRYIDKDGDKSYDADVDTHIEKWDFNATYCVGLEYNATLEHNITLDDDPAECPDGGEIITHIRYIDNNDNKKYDDGDEHIEKWDYNATYCVGLDYNGTLEHNETIEDWKYGESEICPDGGTVISHIRYIDNNDNKKYDEGDEHIEKWDFNTTHCIGLDYNGTLEHNDTEILDPDPDECPYGGELITHIRYIDNNDNEKYDEGDEHIDKWDFNTTHCSEGDRNDYTVEIVLPVGDKTCPNGGKIVEHNVTNNDITEYEFNSTHCGRHGYSTDTGLDTNITVAGYVTDINGSRLEGADVSIVVDGTIYEVVTGVNGVYEFYNIKLGSTVTIHVDGYTPAENLLVTSSILDVILVPASLSYVADMNLIFFSIDRDMGADKALEYADVKGWRLLTLEELQALYHSDRKSQFKPAEYFSSSNELDAYGMPVGDDYGYTLWTVNFSDGSKLPHWFSHRKHVVFTDDDTKAPRASKEFIETTHWTDWYTANSVCATEGKRLPKVDEMKDIYFNSGHPIGIADQDIIGGEYWTIEVVKNVDENGDEYKSAKFFRVVGPVEDYYIEKYADPRNPKKVVCVEPDGDEEVTISGIVQDWSGKRLDNVIVSFRTMDYEGELGDLTYVRTGDDGTYSIVVPSSRYFVQFMPTIDASDIMDTNYRVEQMNIDLRVDTVLDVNFTAPNLDSDYNYDNELASNGCDDAIANAPECERVAFDVDSNLDTDTDTWTYSVTKNGDGNVDKAYFTLELSQLCMEQITDLTADASPVRLGGSLIPNGIKTSGDNFSFVVHSSAEYDSDVNSPLVISTENGQRLSVNIATPVCFPLDEDNTVKGSVVNTEGDPISGVSISAVTTYENWEDDPQHTDYTFSTNSDGRFTTDVTVNLKNETITATFTASKDGYEAVEQSTKTATIERDVENDVGTLVLKAKDIDVTGTVTDEVTGEPLAGVTVVITDNKGATATYTTDNDGRYTHTSKVGRTVTINVSLDLFESETVSSLLSPSVHNFDFQLKQLEEIIEISAVVVDEADSSPISGATIITYNPDKQAIGTTVTSEDGVYNLSVRKLVAEEFSAIIAVKAEGYEDKNVSVDAVTESTNKGNIPLVAKPGYIHIYVDSYETGEMLKNVVVNLFVPTEADPFDSNSTLDDGFTSLNSIVAGDYRVSVSLSTYVNVSLPVTVQKGKVTYLYISMDKVDDGEILDSFTSSREGYIYKYKKDGEMLGKSKFKVTSDYDDESETWTYSVERTLVVKAGAELSHFVVELDSVCLGAVTDATEGFESGTDGSTGAVGLKWNTTGGSYSFKVNEEYEASQTTYVPVTLKAGDIGELENEGMTVIINLPGPVCSQ